MSTLDHDIDELYTLPLAEFTAARNALAKTLKGDEATRVKQLAKPSAVPWAVNQLYWRERRTYDRLMAAGRALRAAQIAALKGKSTDLRTAATEHRAALAEALSTATRLAASHGSHPASEPLSRMLEALSLAAEPPESSGRFTDLLQPAGFEALAGVAPVARAHAAPPPPPHKAEPRHVTPASKRPSAAEAAAERKRAEAAAERRRAAEKAEQAAKHKVDLARAAEARAQSQVHAARQHLERLESALAEARSAVDRAAQEHERTAAALKTL